MQVMHDGVRAENISIFSVCHAIHERLIWFRYDQNIGHYLGGGGVC